MDLFSSFLWDPDRVFFIVPYLNFPIFWYGFLFALGFEFEYLFVKKIMKRFMDNPALSGEQNRACAVEIMTRLTVYSTIAAVIGARLGHILFYGLPYYLAHPLDMFNIRQGGLASHGAMIALIIALFFLSRSYRKRYPQLTWLAFLDMLAIPVGLTCACIRLGNFINQEITGLPTNLPWGVEFLHPIDGVGGVVHPVQLYEGVAYLAIGMALLLLWRKRKQLVGTGFFFAIFLLGLSLSRLFLESFKVAQGEVLSSLFGLKMGQLLSLPFVIVGILMLLRYRKITRSAYASKIDF